MDTVMDTAFITPMKIWDDIGIRGDEQNTGQQAGGQVNLFADVFRNAIDQVKETQADVEEKQYLLATGQLADAHALPIAEAKAGLTVDVLITLRNKTLEAYNDLIKISM